MIEASGGTVANAKRGSGRRITFGGQRANLHAPHSKELSKGAVEALREILEESFEEELRELGINR